MTGGKEDGNAHLFVIARSPSQKDDEATSEGMKRGELS